MYHKYIFFLIDMLVDTRISDNIPARAVILPAFACLSTVFQVMDWKKY